MIPRRPWLENASGSHLLAELVVVVGAVAIKLVRSLT